MMCTDDVYRCCVQVLCIETGWCVQMLCTDVYMCCVQMMCTDVVYRCHISQCHISTNVSPVLYKATCTVSPWCVCVCVCVCVRVYVCVCVRARACVCIHLYAVIFNVCLFMLFIQ